MFRIYMTTQPPELQPLSFASVQGLVSSWVVWNGSRAPATWLRNSSAHCSLVHLLILSKCAFRRVTSCFKLSWSTPVGIFQPKVKLALDMQNCGLWKSEKTWWKYENEICEQRLMEWTVCWLSGIRINAWSTKSSSWFLGCSHWDHHHLYFYQAKDVLEVVINMMAQFDKNYFPEKKPVFLVKIQTGSWEYSKIICERMKVITILI